MAPCSSTRVLEGQSQRDRPGDRHIMPIIPRDSACGAMSQAIVTRQRYCRDRVDISKCTKGRANLLYKVL